MSAPYPPQGAPGPYGGPPPPPPQPQVSSGWKIAMYLICFILGFPIGTILALVYVRKKDAAAGKMALILSLVGIIIACVLCLTVFATYIAFLGIGGLL